MDRPLGEIAAVRSWAQKEEALREVSAYSTVCPEEALMNEQCRS
jgi:hypothetical protein